MAENGKGEEITVNTQWTGQIVDRSWFTAERYAKYRQPGNIKILFWLQPVKKYTGAAWYRRTIDIPRNWKNKRIILFLERCHWETKVWVDGQYAGMRNTLATPHEYDLTPFLSSGQHTLTIRVDNRVKAVNPGVNAHSITDHTQSNWNVIAGRIRLIAEPSIDLTDIRLFPDIKAKTVIARITIDNPAKKTVKGRITLRAAGKNMKDVQIKSLSRTVTLPKGTQTVEIVYPIGEEVLLWDEFHPNLYNMHVILETPAGRQTEDITFGMRKFATSGTRFIVNGRPVFLRGTLDCAAYPLTGYPPTDEEAWTRVFRTIRNHGLNHVRFHSWCPPEAAFLAADKLGLYLQVECSAWANGGSSIGDGKPIDAWVYKESKSIVKNYGNHPSFCMMAYGNEPGGKHQKEYLRKFVEYWKAKDPRRVYTAGAGWPLCSKSVSGRGS